MGTCAEFMQKWKSDYLNCFSCKWWNMPDFICLNPEEIKKRRKQNEFDEMDREMKGNKGVKGPL